MTSPMSNGWMDLPGVASLSGPGGPTISVPGPESPSPTSTTNIPLEENRLEILDPPPINPDLKKVKALDLNLHELKKCKAMFRF